MRTKRVAKSSIALVGALLASFLWAAPAAAHPLLERARERYQQADFPAALRLLDEAEASTDLSRDDLVLLLETRVLVSFALGEQSAVERDLRRIASIAPDHVLGPEAGPELQAAARSAREGTAGAIDLDVRVEPDPAGSGAFVETTVRNDPLGLVRLVRVHGRLTAGAWQRSDEGRLVLSIGPSWDYYAQAIGPGGATLASSGSLEAPLHYTRAPPPGFDWPLFAGLTAAAAVAATVAIVVLAVVLSPGQPTGFSLGTPTVEGW